MNETEWNVKWRDLANSVGDTVRVRLINDLTVYGYLTYAGPDGIQFLEEETYYETSFPPRVIASAELCTELPPQTGK